MPDAAKLIKTIKRAALEAFEASKPVQVCFGVVKNVKPLKIYVEQKMTLGEKQLISLQDISRTETVSSTASVASYAESFVGKIPYLLGAGRGHNTLEEIVAAGGMCDCSAFTERVYRHFGAEIGTVVSAQESAGTQVSASEVRDGDLLILEDGWHAGIYKNGGLVIHEGGENYTGNVKISPLYAFNLKQVRRIAINGQQQTTVVRDGLKIGDEVVLLRQQGGQKYVVLGRIV